MLPSRRSPDCLTMSAMRLRRGPECIGEDLVERVAADRIVGNIRCRQRLPWNELAAVHGLGAPRRIARPLRQSPPKRPVLSPFRDWIAASGRRSRSRRTRKSTRARPAPQSALNRAKPPTRLNAEATPLRAQAENIGDQVASVAWAENQVGHRGVGRLQEAIQGVRGHRRHARDGRKAGAPPGASMAPWHWAQFRAASRSPAVRDRPILG